MITKVDVNELKPDELIVVEDCCNRTVWYGHFLRVDEGDIIIYDFDVQNEMNAGSIVTVYKWDLDVINTPVRKLAENIIPGWESDNAN